ncbi:bifunctional metallophosphatase/5'-nucleotidase [Neptunicella sp.]|uniref:bifunctional metallophosphatase/5'-nucleotidase n=1 Tax=Neptunicella sp. TaxID=2125986 RepID=UPI003F68BFDB
MSKRLLNYLLHSILCCTFLVSLSSLAATEKATIVFTGNMPEISVPNIGGYAELGTLLKQARQHNSDTFFLFSGASLGPSGLSTLDKGSHIIDLLNTLEPDAMAVSKREFSYFEDELSLRAFEAAFPLVASNIFDPLTKGNLDGLVGSAIIDKNNYRLGILSVVDISVIEEYAVKRLQIIDPEKAIRQQASLLRQQGADIVVLIYSVDFPGVKQLLNQKIVDLILHKDNYVNAETNSPATTLPNEVFITEPGVAAVVNLTWQSNKHESLTIQWQKHYLKDYPQEPQITEQISGYTGRLNRLLAEPIGQSQIPIDTRRLQIRTAENAFANYIVDSIKQYSGADIAVLNSGAIRGEKRFPANYVLTRKDISDVLPYRSSVVMLDVSGQQILDALENGLSIVEQVKGRYLQVSGVKIVYNSANKPGHRVIKVQINNQPLVTNKQYTLATTDYVAAGGDGYSMLSSSHKILQSNQAARSLSDIVINQIVQDKIISPVIESRLVDQAPQN